MLYYVMFTTKHFLLLILYPTVVAIIYVTSQSEPNTADHPPPQKHLELSAVTEVGARRVLLLQKEPRLKDCIKVQEKKKKVVVVCSRPRQNVKLQQAVSRCSPAKTAMRCTKKREARAKLLFSLSKPIAFLPFSLPSPSSSSLRKLPISQESFADVAEITFSLNPFTARVNVGVP